MQAVETILAYITELTEQQPVRIIGVNGIDTSGKTHFARKLAAYLQNRDRDILLIHLDDFHNPRAMRATGPDEITAYIDNAFDLDTLAGELLRPLQQFGTLDKSLTLLDLDRDTYTNRLHFRAGPDTIVILEGILLYREPLVSCIDYRIFLDISFEEELRRAAIRDAGRYDEDVLERYRRKYIPIQQWYIDTHDPVGRSHLVIDNNDFRAPFIKKTL